MTKIPPLIHDEKYDKEAEREAMLRRVGDIARGDTTLATYKPMDRSLFELEGIYWLEQYPDSKPFQLRFITAMNNGVVNYIDKTLDIAMQDWMASPNSITTKRNKGE